MLCNAVTPVLSQRHFLFTMTRRQRTCVVRTAGACCVGPGGLLLLCATPTTCGAPCFVLCALQRPRPPGPCSGAPQLASCLPVDGFSTPLATWWFACGRGPPAQVSAGAARAWASHCALCCNHVHPLSRRSLLLAIPCAAGAARGLGLLQRTGVTGIRMFIWPRARGATGHPLLGAPGRPPRPKASGRCGCQWLHRDLKR